MEREGKRVFLCLSYAKIASFPRDHLNRTRASPRMWLLADSDYSGYLCRQSTCWSSAAEGDRWQRIVLQEEKKDESVRNVDDDNKKELSDDSPSSIRLRISSILPFAYFDNAYIIGIISQPHWNFFTSSLLQSKSIFLSSAEDDSVVCEREQVKRMKGENVMKINKVNSKLVFFAERQFNKVYVVPYYSLRD